MTLELEDGCSISDAALVIVTSPVGGHGSKTGIVEDLSNVGGCQST